MKQKLIILVLGMIILTLVFYSGRLAGEAAGRVEAEQKYEKIMQDYRTALNNQTEALNKALQIEQVDLTNEVNGLLKDTQVIKQQLKNQPQPLVLIKEGECKASDAALEARRKMIERVNK